MNNLLQSSLGDNVIQHSQNLSLSNQLPQPVPPPNPIDLSSNDSKYSLDYQKTTDGFTIRGAEPPPPTTRFLNFGCIKSCLKFGIPFFAAVCVGAALNYALQKTNSTNIIGAFLQTWIPIIFVICYLRWKYFRVVVTAELLLFFFISLLGVFPYAFGLVVLSHYIENKWDVFEQTIAQWLTGNRFLMLCINSFLLVAFVVEIYKITFLCSIYKRKLIACPTALIIYGVVISSSASSAMEALFIYNQESVWVGVIVIIISLPINIATGVYEAMYFATKRFADSSIHETHNMSIDSMDITIEYNTKKNQVSSKFAFTSRSNKYKESENLFNQKSLTGDDVNNTLSVKADVNGNSNQNNSLYNDHEIPYYNVNVTSPVTYKTYSETDLTGKRYIVNFDRNAENSVFRPYLMFTICWLSHSIIQLLMVFVDALFRECYSNEIFLKTVNGTDYILCQKHTTFWISLLWILIMLCLVISLSFIGYIRHLWLLYFKDGTKINVHYLLMCNQVNLPSFCCKCCYFCEIHSHFDEYGVLLSSVRDMRLSTNERIQYQHMKHQLDNITYN